MRDDDLAADENIRRNDLRGWKKDWTVRLADSSTIVFAHTDPETMVNDEGAITTEQFIARTPT